MSTYINTLGGGGGSGGSGSSDVMLTFSVSGLPVDGQIIIIPIPDGITITLPADLDGSQGRCDTAPTAQSDFDVQKNGVSAGTIRFASAANVATFIAASSIVLNGTNGDYLKIVCPIPQDTALKDVGVALKGTKS
jgi:hypothetical protein